MRTNHRHCLLIPALAIVAASIVTTRAGAAETPTLDEIKAKTAERLAALEGKEIKIEWTSEKKLPFDGESGFVGLKPAGWSVRKPAPDKLSASGTFILRGRSSRSDETRQGPPGFGKTAPYKGRIVRVSHGDTFTKFSEKDGHRQAELSRSGQIYDTAEERLFCWFATADHLDEQAWTVEMREDGDGKPAAVLHAKLGRRSDHIIELWLDPARGFLPVRMTSGTDPAKGWSKSEEYVAEYVQRPDGTWAIAGGSHGRTTIHGERVANKMKVDAISINPASEDDSIFEIEIPEGTDVMKPVLREPRHYDGLRRAL